jgi:hypothetical protein
LLRITLLGIFEIEPHARTGNSGGEYYGQA